MSPIPDRRSTLDQWLDWLLKMHPTEIDLGLDRIREVASRMGLLSLKPLVITVAGTNGKGSSVAMLVSVLQAAGYRVGSYTSPHIQRFNERIQINQQMVDDATIIQALVDIESAREQTSLTFFEYSTLAAIAIFAQADLDVIVLEVGLGGRLDAVNVIDADAALITAIDVDHIEWLGDDRSQIAIEKAGITRAGRLAVCSDFAPPASLADYALKQHVPLLQAGIDFSFTDTAGSSVSEALGGESCWQWQFERDVAERTDFYQSFQTLETITTSAVFNVIDLALPSLKGRFQLQNASGVVTLLVALWELGHLPKALSAESLLKALLSGLSSARHPGRLQSRTVNGRDWLMDVAHNPQSAKVLAEYLQQQDLECVQQNGANQNSAAQNSTALNGRSAVAREALFSVLGDKDALPMVAEIAPFVQTWHLAHLDNPRAMSVAKMCQVLQAAGVKEQSIIVYDSMAQAVQARIEAQKNDNHACLVFGSFFTVAQVFDALDQVAG